VFNQDSEMLKIISESQLEEKNYSSLNLNEFLSRLLEKINLDLDSQKKFKEKIAEVGNHFLSKSTLLHK
jgi:hypothetical protein